MKEKYYKYAELLLKKGLDIKAGQPLLVNFPAEAMDFIRVLTEVAMNLGVRDIYYDISDEELKHMQLKYYSIEDIKNSRFWNKSIHDEYAKKGAAFLFLVSSVNDRMKDIDNEKLEVAQRHSLQTRKLYREMQEKNEVDWCIASVATKEWGDMIYGDITDSREKLWETIFDICLINEDDPCLAWTNKMEENRRNYQKLNDLHIKELHYRNSLGTDLKIGLSDKARWLGGASLIKGREIIVNIPTEEVFTTPDKHKTNGVVYCSKPLLYSGSIIKDIMLEFKDGKVVNYSASSNQQVLKNIIDYDEESSYLGEVALVDYDSKISNTNIIFYETLFDENASCHIALGRGFRECLENGNDLNDLELEEVGYDKSRNHVDVMIGTKDLEIIAKTSDDLEIELFKNGGFCI